VDKEAITSGKVRCRAAYEALEDSLCTTEACITEALDLLDHADAAVQAILTNLQSKAIEVPFQLGDCVSEIAHLMSKYADTPCDFTDACLIHLADQMNTGDILTLDSDFKHYHWRRNRRFRMLIPLE
jgi:predicted nucleic acid-binding protein